MTRLLPIGSVLIVGALVGFAQAQESNWVLKHDYGPLGIETPVVVYDEGRHEGVLFGRYGKTNHDDYTSANSGTWVTTNWINWVKRKPAHSPLLRSWHAMAYDAARAETVLFGGWDDTTLQCTNDTWVWNGVDWLKKTPLRSPPPSCDHAMAYHPATGQVVLFGGNPSGYTFEALNQTWVWDGSNWTQRFPQSSPPARELHALATSSNGGGVVLFGGSFEQRFFDDTWEWNGFNWIQLSPTTKPSPRRGHRMAFDSAHGLVYLFGGENYGGKTWAYEGPQVGADTWRWDGKTWTEINKSSAERPPERWLHSMVYDTGGGQVTLFGGWGDDAVTFHDVWVMKTVASTNNRTSRPDFNGDGRPDFIWQDGSAGTATVWYSPNPSIPGQDWDFLFAGSMTGWRIIGSGDFNSDGKPDLVWQNDASRQVTVWYMGGPGGNIMKDWAWLSPNELPNWRLVAIDDFNRDGKPDILWQHDESRQLYIWYMGGMGGTSRLNIMQVPTTDAHKTWRVVGSADFNRDGFADLVWQKDDSRVVTVWYMGGTSGNEFQSFDWLSSGPNPNWRIVAIADYNLDGTPDLVWQNERTLTVTLWDMDIQNGQPKRVRFQELRNSGPRWRIASAWPPIRRTVFVIHGISQSAADVASLGNTLRDAQFGIDPTRFIVDAGFDYSDCADKNGCSPSCTVDNQARMLATYINNKKPTENFVLIGYSLGGLVARDMMWNGYSSVLANRGIAALVTLGTPHLGYPYLYGDVWAKCDTLIRDMASNLNKYPSGQVSFSPYLSHLMDSWYSTSFPGQPGSWLAVAGTFCPYRLRDTNNPEGQGCPADLPYSDGVVCEMSALALIPSTSNPSSPTMRISDSTYAHIDNWKSTFVLCGNWFGNANVLYNPPASGGIVKAIRELINGLP